MSTVSDPEGRPTVIDLVPPALRKALVPVGRLDFQSEGLLLLTNDGEFAQRSPHPRYGCAKTYEVEGQGHARRGATSNACAAACPRGPAYAPADVPRRPGAPPARPRDRQHLVGGASSPRGGRARSATCSSASAIRSRSCTGWRSARLRDPDLPSAPSAS